VMDTRHLVVNADDLGLGRGVNDGIFRAHDFGIVTSASLMVRRSAAADAAAGARRRPQLGVGLHFDLGEWVFADDAWRAVEQVVDPEDPEAVADELARQIGAFRRLVGREPTHLDSHQHVHLTGAAGDIARTVARDLGIPLRGRNAAIRYCGDFYGQTGTGEPLHELITPAALATLIEELPPGVTELACHPGLGTAIDSPYSLERAREVTALCHPTVAEAARLAGVRLCSFGEVSIETR
jgi:chitin disaccharide deacetylase